MVSYIRQNEEVYYLPKGIVKFSKDDIEFIKSAAKKNTRQRSRFCTHCNIESSVHEMMIVHCNGIYVRPHNHENKSESFHVIEGEVDIVIFDQNGNICDIITMGEYCSGKVFYYRLPENIFHTVIIRSAIAIFHEVTSGPFVSNSTTYADWSPAEEDITEVERFTKKLNLMVADYFNDGKSDR